MMFHRSVHDRISGAGGQVEQRSSMLHDAHARCTSKLTADGFATSYVFYVESTLATYLVPDLPIIC